MRKLPSSHIGQILQTGMKLHDEIGGSPVKAQLVTKADGVSVIMVTYHAGQVLYKSIASVLEEPLISELILIDNGSAPDVVEHLRDLAQGNPRVRYLQMASNLGFGKAVNRGAVEARYPWLLVLNPDAFLQKDCVARLKDAAAGQPSPCLVGARLLNEDLTEQRGSRRGEITPVTTLVSLLRVERLLPFLRKFELHYHDRPLPEQPVPVPTVSGACFLVSKTDFERLGGFDEAFFLHVEDVDLCWRARQMGGVVLFHPFAEVIHVGHTSLVDPTFVEHHKGEGLVYFFNKRADTPWRKTYLWFLKPLIIGMSYARARLRKPQPNDE